MQTNVVLTYIQWRKSGHSLTWIFICTLLPMGEEYLVLGAWIKNFCVAGIALCVLENNKCFVGRYRVILWFNPNMQKLALWLTLALPSPNAIFTWTTLAINDSLLLCEESSISAMTLRWRHNGRDSVSNHQPHDCLLNRLFRRRSKKTSKLRVTGLCAGHSPVPVTRKMFPFDDVIMIFDAMYAISSINSSPVLLIIWFWFYCIHFETYTIHCKKINADKKVVAKQLIYKP